MIQFRCWYCNKDHVMPEACIGKRFLCTCQNLLRVPKRSGKSCRVRSLLDGLVEAVVYGGAGALLGLGLGLYFSRGRAYILGGLIVGGFLIGLFAGERGIDWIGSRIRDREDS